MKQTHTLARILTRTAFAASLAGLLCVGGCVLPTEGSREIRVEPQNRYIRYTTEFPEAYIAPAAEGGYDLLLVDAGDSQSRDSAGRLLPLASGRNTQVIHMHIAWRPMRGATSNFPAATNTTVHWYVLNGQPAGSEGMVEYSGIGFVKLDIDTHDSLVDIQNLTIKPLTITGSARDPFGPARLQGKVRARNDAAAVSRVLGQLQEQLHAAAAAPTAPPAVEPSGMPPRRGHPGP
jgi:hypothetical protein